MRDKIHRPKINATERQLAWGKAWRKFLRLTRGRVGTVRAIEIIADEEPQFSHVASVMRKLKTDLDKGASLSDAICLHKDDFSTSVLELVRTAEKTGDWDEIIQELADGLIEGTFT